MNSAKGYDTVGMKMVAPWIDVSYDLQERTIKLGESYLKVFLEGQKMGFDSALGWLKRVQELQSLSFDYIRESARSGNETLADLVRVQDEVRHDVQDRFEKQVTELEKVATKAASAK